jgi:hypothetical protein
VLDASHVAARRKSVAESDFWPSISRRVGHPPYGDEDVRGYWLLSARSGRRSNCSRVPRPTLREALSASDMRDHFPRIVSPINRDTTSEMYMTPVNSSTMTSARAIGDTGTMSPRPTPDRQVKLRNSNSIQERDGNGE